jgi:hypothetical protein
MEQGITRRIEAVRRELIGRAADEMTVAVARSGSPAKLHLEDEMKRVVASSPAGEIVIGSAVPYHAEVEARGPGTRWTKASTVPQFTRHVLEKVLEVAPMVVKRHGDP